MHILYWKEINLFKSLFWTVDINKFDMTYISLTGYKEDLLSIICIFFAYHVLNVPIPFIFDN